MASNYTDELKVKISERYKPPPRISPALTYTQRQLNKKQTELDSYEFNLEKTVLNRLKEWRNCKLKHVEDRKSRLEKREKLKEENVEISETKEENLSFFNNILVPTQVPTSSKYTLGIKNDDKSPFNLSDFENDTSSPFDNMELKSINDMEELARVLNKNNHQQVYHQPNQTYQSTSFYTDRYYIPNGCYYYQPSFQQKSYCKSVPDLANALEQELENIEISSVDLGGSSSARPKSTDGTFRKKLEVDPLENLSESDRDLCRNVSAMGFPLERVCRVHMLIGNDQKKIVDHLLALSDLLDLGFSEKKVSEALLQCENDRDKALDKLIL